MKSRQLAVALLVSLALTACTVPNRPIEPPISTDEYSRFDLVPASLGDPALLNHIKHSVETDLVDAVDGQEAVVENVEAIYYSKEYLEEVAFNSQRNIYFGYTLPELENQFEGQKYVFAPDGQGNTIAKPFEEYDNTYDQIIRNVTIGSGVILLLVTVAVLTPETGAAAVISVLAVASAKSAAIFAGSDALLSAIVAAVITGVQTGDLEQALKDAGLAGSEGFMWGAIAGALVGGLAALSRLRGATRGGLTLAEAAEAQRTGIPQSTAKLMRSGDELAIYKGAGLKGKCKFRGNGDLIRDVDLRYVKDGQTNLERMKLGHAPRDPATGLPLELHHIGQEEPPTIAILTQAEHRTHGDNFKILHPSKTSKVEHGNAWRDFREDFWKYYAAEIGLGLLAECLS